MPMVFKWAVTLAHNATSNVIRAAYTITPNTPVLKDHQHALKLFRKTEAPFDFRSGLALSLAIIDDISIVVSGWPDAALIMLYETLIKLLTRAFLPIATAKSIDPGKIEDPSYRS